MKPFLTIIINLFFIVNISFAQAPPGFNYQVIVRDADGNIRADQGISLAFEIQLPTGSVVYRETHTTITNKFGLANVIIGKGATSYKFIDINWGSGIHMLQVSIDGVDVGSSSLEFNHIYTEALTNSSDERLKENIKPLTYGLEFINKLNPVSYDKMKVSDFLSNKKPKELNYEIGLLAQEVKEISEELDFDNRIVTVGENGIHRMDYQKIMMPLVKAIQEQQEMIESLREEMEILK